MSKHSKQTERLRRIVESFPKITVTVAGDMVADEFIFGEISRVSREAPVLILRHRERTVVPGGGANAVNNLADLGVNVLPVGLVGDDEPGRLLLRGFRHKRIPVSGVLKDKTYSTITKTRILAGMTHTWRQQVVRVDREPESEPNHRLQRELVLAAREYARASDALLISDYGYGAATPAILNAIREKGELKGVPVVLDSRHRMLQYSGVAAATPNEPEVEEALGLQIGHNWSAASRGQRDCVAHEVAIPRDYPGARRHGCLQPTAQSGGYTHFRVGRGHRRHRRGRYRDCDSHRGLGGRRNHGRGGASGQLCRRHRRDETGYGDGLRARTHDCAGTGSAYDKIPLSAEAKGKIVNRQQLRQRVADWRGAGDSITLANGCFDLLHVGHVRYLRSAKELGGRLIVAINSDESVRALKGEGRPLMPAEERAEILAALADVDAVVVFPEPDVRELIREIRPDVQAKGTDYTAATVPERDVVVECGGRVEIVGDPKNHSASEIIRTRLGPRPR